MNFPLITIPDPAEVGHWLDRKLPDDDCHAPMYSKTGWYGSHYPRGGPMIHGEGDTPESLLADIRRQLAERDPVAKLRKEAEAAGFSLVANNPAQPPR